MRKTNPYEKFEDHELILRDELALDRTILANERTILAYIRTAFVFCVSGVTLIKLFPANQLAVISGYLCFPMAGVCFLFGLMCYIKVRRMMQNLSSCNKHK